jgi:hypothetical protein
VVLRYLNCEMATATSTTNTNAMNKNSDIFEFLSHTQVIFHIADVFLIFLMTAIDVCIYKYMYMNISIYIYR